MYQIHEVAQVQQLLWGLQWAQKHLPEAPHSVILIDRVGRRLPHCIGPVLTDLQIVQPCVSLCHDTCQHWSMRVMLTDPWIW